MFTNQVSKRDLLYNSSERSDGENFSQLQNSQYEFSQMSTGSDTQSQGKKMVDKYSGYGSGRFTPMNHGKPSFNNKCKEVHSSHLPQAPYYVQASSSFQEKLMMNKVKARENDERDLMNSIIRTVRDCSDELKGTLKAVQDNIGELMNSSDVRVSCTITSITDIVDKNFKKILDIIQVKEEEAARFQNLQEDINKKETTIAQLHKQLENEKERLNGHLLRSLSNMVKEQQKNAEEKLQSLLSMSMELIKNQQHMIQIQKENDNASTKIADQIKNTSESINYKFGIKIQDEVSNLRKDLEKQKEDIIQFYEMELQTIHKRQSQEIERQFSLSFEESSSLLVSKTEEIGKFHHSKLQETIKRHYDDLRSYFKQQKIEGTGELSYPYHLKSYTSCEKYPSKDLRSSWEKKDSTSINERSWSSEQSPVLYKKQQNNPENLPPLSENKEELCDTFPPEIQERLTAMHLKHKEERERILKEIEEREYDSKETNMYTLQNIVDQRGDNSDRQFNGMESSYKKSNKESEVVNFKSPGFSNERSTWSSNVLFHKINPSPIAAVKPQPKQTESQQSSASGNEDGQRDKWKQRGHILPQRQSQRIAANARTNFSQDRDKDIEDNSKISQSIGTFIVQSEETTANWIAESDNGKNKGKYGRDSEGCQDLKEMNKEVEMKIKDENLGSRHIAKYHNIVKPIQVYSSSSGLCNYLYQQNANQSKKSTTTRENFTRPSIRTPAKPNRSYTKSNSSVYDFTGEHSPRQFNFEIMKKNRPRNSLFSTAKPEKGNFTTNGCVSSPLSENKVSIKRKKQIDKLKSPVALLFGKYKTDVQDSVFPRYAKNRHDGVFSSPEVHEVTSSQRNFKDSLKSDSCDSSPSMSVTKIFIKRKKQSNKLKSPVSSLFGKYKTYLQDSVFPGYASNRHDGVFSSPEVHKITSPQQNFQDSFKNNNERKEDKRRYSYDDEYLEISEEINKKASKKSRYN